MNKKLQIGILTYFNAKNYGCVLQAYAMIHFFSKFGKTKIINYIPNYLDNQDKIINLDFLKKNLKFKERILLFKITISKLVKLIFLIERKNKFNNFVRKYLKINTKNKIIDEYGLSNLNKIDYYVFGSDQIWNSIFKKPVDTNYFGSFTKKNKKKVKFIDKMRSLKKNTNSENHNYQNYQFLNNNNYLNIN